MLWWYNFIFPSTDISHFISSTYVFSIQIEMLNVYNNFDPVAKTERVITPFFYKNPFYKNRQAQNWPKFKNLVRIIPRLTICNFSVKN